MNAWKIAIGTGNWIVVGREVGMFSCHFPIIMHLKGKSLIVQGEFGKIIDAVGKNMLFNHVNWKSHLSILAACPAWMLTVE